MLSIPTAQGRPFEAADEKADAGVVVVNDAFVQKFIPDGRVVGRRIKRGELNSPRPWVTVVGVVGSVRSAGLSVDPQPEVFVPYVTGGTSSMVNLLVRTKLPTRALASPVLEAIHRVDPELAPTTVTDMKEVVGRAVGQPLFYARLFGVLAFIALLLSVVGVYGVAVLGVAARSEEIAIRSCLGAQSGDIVRLILRETAIAVGCAVLLGAAGSWFVQNRMAAFVYGVESMDWIVIAVSALVIASLAMAAVYGAVRRVVVTAAHRPSEAWRRSVRMSAIALRWLRAGSSVDDGSRSRVNTAPPTRLLNGNFLLLWQAQAVSQFGDQAFAIAIAFWAMEATRSATMTGLILMASTLPVVLLGPISGAFADTRRSRIRILIACDLVSGALVLLLALGFVALTPSWRFALLFVVALLMGVSGAFFEPAVDALVPDLIPRDQLERANAMRQSSRQVVALAARGLGGILYALVGPVVLFVLDGLSFVFAAVSQLFIRPPVVADHHAGEPREARRQPLFRQAAEGFRYVAGERGMLRFLVCAAIFNALLMPIAVLLPAFVTDYLHADVRWYGFILAAISGGAMSGCVAIASRQWSGPARRAILVLSFALLAVLLGLLGQVTSRWVALPIVFATGAASGIVNVLVMSIVQRRTPMEFRGRVIGLHATMTRALVPIAMVGGGAIADLTGRNVPLVYGVGGALALGAAVLLASSRPTRDFLA